MPTIVKVNILLSTGLQTDEPSGAPSHFSTIDQPFQHDCFQMWDRDVLTANDIIAETSIDLYRWFLKVRAFLRRVAETCRVSCPSKVESRNLLA